MARWRKPKWMRGLTVARRSVERLRISGPEERRDEVYEAFPVEEGWRFIRSGPFTNRTMFPLVDMTRFLFVLEREGF